MSADEEPYHSIPIHYANMGAEDEEAEAIHGEVQEARVEELEGEESPELEFVEGFLNAEAAPGVE